MTVMPLKNGIQEKIKLDSGLRRNDKDSIFVSLALSECH
jgi:hypothetical protein